MALFSTLMVALTRQVAPARHNQERESSVARSTSHLSRNFLGLLGARLSQ